MAFMAETQEPAPGYAEILVRSDLPPSAVTGALTATFAEIDPRIAVTYSVMTTNIRGTLLREQLLATLSGGFGALAAILTIVGLYGVIAYTVTRRTAEIGVRLALGATRSDIARVILRETTLLLVLGRLCRRGARAAGRPRRSRAALQRHTPRSAHPGRSHPRDHRHRAGGQLQPRPARDADRACRRAQNGISAVPGPVLACCQVGSNLDFLILGHKNRKSRYLTPQRTKMFGISAKGLAAAEDMQRRGQRPHDAGGLPEPEQRRQGAAGRAPRRAALTDPAVARQQD